MREYIIIFFYHQFPISKCPLIFELLLQFILSQSVNALEFLDSLEYEITILPLSNHLNKLQVVMGWVS